MTSTKVLEQDAHRRLHGFIFLRWYVVTKEVFSIFADDAPLCAVRIVIGLTFACAHAQVGPVGGLLIINKQSRFDLAIGCEFNQESLLVLTALLLIFVALP